MKAHGRLLLLSAVLLYSVAPVWARSFRVNQIPNGSTISCSACHVNAGGGGARNAFGQLVERSFLNNDNVVWGPLLASLDADGDGVTNGIELQDKFGQWQSGQPNPGNSSLVTLPGVSSSNVKRTLTVQFSGMDPHVGQKLNLRVVDKSTGMEVGRQTIPSISGASFNVAVPGILDGGSYWVDFFADLNGNGRYDAPPTDHAWRVDANNAAGNTTLNFAHNTNFSDIGWVYLLTLNAQSMTPHSGDLFELRVVDTATDREVGRARVEIIPGASFSVLIPGLEFNHTYRADFYGDLNGNGRYDAPPTDHAWRTEFTNPDGDVTLNFTHNTTFTDVAWEYLMQINFLSMSPHLGDLFELRVVDQANENEVNRISLASVTVPDFSIMAPGILRQGNYRADFYADLSGNGTYDAPPTDHAWRQTANSVTGNTVLNFVHNTDFTDINWPVLAADDPASVYAPVEFTLEQNYPNPFNPTTTLAFDLARAGDVRLAVFNVMGQQVAELAQGPMAAGHYQIHFDGSDLASGLYIYRLETSGFAAEKKMLLMK